MTSVLVIDDEFDVSEVLCALLADAGYSVRSARDGREGLARLAEDRPDLVLLDLMMPRLDGAGVLRAMAEDEALRAVPVVVMSAGPNVRDTAARHGCAGYLQKPFDVERLFSTVERIAPREESR